MGWKVISINGTGTRLEQHGRSIELQLYPGGVKGKERKPVRRGAACIPKAEVRTAAVAVREQLSIARCETTNTRFTGDRSASRASFNLTLWISYSSD